MAVSKTENTVICNTGRWRGFQSGVAMRGSQQMVLCGFVIALIANGNVLAQPSSVEKWGDPKYEWSVPGGRTPVYPQIVDERSVFSDRLYTVGQRRRISSSVTIHELRHHVPGRATKEYDRALKAKEKGEDEKAVAHFKRAIAVDPEFCAALNDLGTTYIRLDRTDLAVEQFQQAIAVDPHAATPYSNLALAYVMQNDYADAESVARRAIDLDRGGTSGLMALGASLVLEGKFTAEAERSLRRVAADCAPAKVLLAMWLAGTGEIASAREQLRTYVAHGDQPGVQVATELLQQLEVIR